MGATDAPTNESMLRMAYAVLNQAASGSPSQELAAEWCKMYRAMREHQGRTDLNEALRTARIFELDQMTPAESPFARLRRPPR